MPLYQALFTSTVDHNDLKVVELDATSKRDAYFSVASLPQDSDWQFTELIRKPLKHGGARAGSGRPTKHGEKTKIKRVPESLAPKIDMLVTALPELRELLSDLEADCEASDSPRYYFLKKALEEIRSIGF